MSWTITFTKNKGSGNDEYLTEFLRQAKANLSGLTFEGSVSDFESQLDCWEGFNKYYTSGKFASRGAYMDIDTLQQIHNRSEHSMSDAYEETEESVKAVMAGESTDYYPLIPFVLEPSEYMYLDESVETEIEYELLREGRSRLSGVIEAINADEYTAKTVPVLFAIRKSRK